MNYQALLIVDTGHDMLGGGGKAGIEHVDVIGRFVDIRRDAGAHEKMDVIEAVHQAGNIVEVLQRCGACLAGFGIEDFNGSSAGTQMDLVAMEMKIVFFIAAAEYDFFRGKSYAFRHQSAVEGNDLFVVIHRSTVFLKQIDRLFKAVFICYPGLFQDLQRSFVEGGDLFCGEGVVLTALQTHITHDDPLGCMAPAGFAPSGFAAIAKKCCFRVDTDMPMLYRLLAWRWGVAELTPQNDFDTIC